MEGIILHQFFVEISLNPSKLSHKNKVNPANVSEDLVLLIGHPLWIGVTIKM